MQEAYEFLKKAGTYWLATAEGDQPRVRPFGTAHIYDGKLYIQTGKVKPVSKQLAANPKAELGAFDGGQWIRIAATLVSDNNLEAEKSLLEAYPSLADRYQPGDGNIEVLYLKDATATFSSFAGEPKVVKF
ncbi:MAG: pyridoxamine 5'-phosphate oxidase family protein [Oscillospiraceae bacterium]|jgi:uncharacterized pyridoxamine 5'-phosphate oxidase family protein|nr:pyridoxamine 5'-phosphate oxidase family protein [Oscillospiraceae bacterium]